MLELKGLFDSFMTPAVSNSKIWDFNSSYAPGGTGRIFWRKGVLSFISIFTSVMFEHPISIMSIAKTSRFFIRNAVNSVWSFSFKWDISNELTKLLSTFFSTESKVAWYNFATSWPLGISISLSDWLKISQKISFWPCLTLTIQGTTGKCPHSAIAICWQIGTLMLDVPGTIWLL